MMALPPTRCDPIGSRTAISFDMWGSTNPQTHAALTSERKRLTCPARSLVWKDSCSAAPSTWLAAEPGSSALLNARDIRIDFLRAPSGFLHASGDFPCGGALLLHRGSNRDADLINRGDHVGHVLDGAHRLVARALDSCNLFGDFCGGFRGLAGQRLDLGRDDSKAAS